MGLIKETYWTDGVKFLCRYELCLCGCLDHVELAELKGPDNVTFVRVLSHVCFFSDSNGNWDNQRSAQSMEGG